MLIMAATYTATTAPCRTEYLLHQLALPATLRYQLPDPTDL
jgi:hypothetical protein